VSRLSELCLVFALVFVTGVGSAVGLVTTQRHYELEEKLPVAVPASCRSAAADGKGDACEDALMHPTWGMLLGAPVAAWGAATQLAAWLAALGLALGLALGARGLASGALAALTALALVAILGTAAFLVIGLGVMGVKCALCLTMHALNAGLGLLVLFAIRGPWRDLATGQTRRLGAWVVAGVSGVGVGILTFGTTAAYGSRYETLGAEEHRLAVDYERWITQGCSKLACPSEARFAASDLPGASSSIVLGEGKSGTTLVEMLDVSCQSCEDHHRYLGGVYRKLLAEGQVGLRLVLWPANRDCNPSLNRRLHYQACSSNFALLCAHRHGSLDTVLAYLDWEFSVGRQVHTAPDREAWLWAQVSPEAAACVREQMARGVENDLRPHMGWALGMLKKASARAFCGGDGDGWWCFNGTPAFGVFGGDSSPYAASEVAATARHASGRPRVNHLHGCLP
jgi:hypothetical protein